jgi:hypothetical protein
MKLRDNQALCDDLARELLRWRPGTSNAATGQFVMRLLDRIERDLHIGTGAASEPAKLLRNDASMIVAVADKFREARGTGPWSTDNLPGKDTEFARFVLTMVDGWLSIPSEATGGPPPTAERCQRVGCGHLLADHNCPKGECGSPGCACSTRVAVATPVVGGCQHAASDHDPREGCKAQVPSEFLPDDWDFCPCESKNGDRCGGTGRTTPPSAPAANNCDGCARGLAVNAAGTHRGPDGAWDLQHCTADRYAESTGPTPGEKT